MKKLCPEHINQIAGSLLQSNAFLAAFDRNKLEFAAPIALTHDTAVVTVGTPGVKWLVYADALPKFLVNQGVLFGWLYVCFVWLREANRDVFERAVSDVGFSARWVPFLSASVTHWADSKVQSLETMMAHFRHAIAHGNVYINYDEAVATKGRAAIALTSLDHKGRTKVAFNLSPKDLFAFGEAVYHAHTAAVEGVSYADVSTRSEFFRIDPPEKVT